MNWDAIGALAELVGAAGVILTLAYLAQQIRISNRASRQAAEQHLLDNSNAWLGRLSESDQLSLIWLKGHRIDSSLTEDEWIRFGAICHEATQNWERSYMLAKDGDISSRVAERDQRTRRLVIGSPGYQKWFFSRKLNLTQEFGNIIEDEIAVAEPYSVPYAEDSRGASEHD